MKVMMCVVLSSLLSAVVISAETGSAKPDWRIELVPSRNSEGKGAVLYAKKPLDVFYIVLHNQSGRNLKVWRDWSPWGYDNLALSADLGSGKIIRINRLPNQWTKPYPDTALVKAGACYVYEVRLAGKTWKAQGKLPNDLPFKLTVWFKVPASPESKQKGVWTGEVKSVPMEVTLRQ